MNSRGISQVHWLTFVWKQFWSNGRVHDRYAIQRVHRLKEAASLKNIWDRRIVELADGKSVAEILEILYEEELRTGAWVTDIGMWRGVFDRCLAVSIRELAVNGHLFLEPETN